MNGKFDLGVLERQARADMQTGDDVHVTAVDCADVLALIAEVRRLAMTLEAAQAALRDAIASNTANGEALDTARALLRRLREWDVMSTGDGEYWQAEIDKVISL